MSNRHSPVSDRHHPLATALTRTGKPDNINRKPYRSKHQKQIARATAVQGKDGVFRSTAPVAFNTSGYKRSAA